MANDRRCSACGGGGYIEPFGRRRAFGVWPICEPCGGTGWLPQEQEGNPSPAQVEPSESGKSGTPIIITVSRRSSYWHACVGTDTGIWGCGWTTDEALGNLLYNHPDVFGVVVKHK